MRFQPSSHYRLPLLVLGLCLLFLPVFVAAQDDRPAPTFMYRDENRLVLLNVYTGETNKLPFEVADEDRFEWSPDGKYLLARFRNDEDYSYCLNLYEIDTQQWVFDESISCGVESAKFSSDSTQLVYSSNDGNNASLWLYSPQDMLSQELYRTTDGIELNPNGISDLQWSPAENYLSYVRYSYSMYGTINVFMVIDMESLKTITVKAPDLYYASYNPVWSPDDSMFLIRLKQEYVTSINLPLTNHQGDIYLINSQTGDHYRLTYSPDTYEQDLRWTLDGDIAFTVVTAQQAVTLTDEQAMNIEPPDPIVEISWPEPVDAQIYHSEFNKSSMPSPDPNFAAWVSPASGLKPDQTYKLKIGGTLTVLMPDFSMRLPADYLQRNILIGWRPSGYHYGYG